jgi:uncharacterized membrane protein
VVLIRFRGVQQLAGFLSAHLPGRALIFCRVPFITIIAFVALGGLRTRWR